MPFDPADTAELLEAPETPEVKADAPEKPAGDKPQVSDRERDLSRQLKEERQARKQAEEGMRHWYDRAAGAAAPREPEAKPEPEPEIDVIELLTTKGQKGLDEYIDNRMKKAGVARSADVDAKINRTRAEVTQEAQLVAKYPDLTDESSEFYQTTLEVYKEMAKDPVIAKSPALLETAAKMAARQLGVETKPARRAARQAEDEPDDAERDRVARVGRQSGDRGARQRREPEDENELSGMQKSVIAKFKAAGADITEDGYKKRAQGGIQMSGLPTRRHK
jgi:hypothetical protein